MIRYCEKCLNTDTRPNSKIDQYSGLCPVCLFENEKTADSIDWDKRRKKLNELVLWGKEKTKSIYDCVIPVSGGKDSFRQSFYVRDNLHLNPLLVSYVYPPERGSDRGPKNLATLISHGFNCISLSVDPGLCKKLIREAFFQYGNLLKPTEMSLYSVPLRIAIAYSIPLVFFGENPAYTKGENWGDDGYDASKLWRGNTVADDIKQFGYKLNSNESAYFYNFPPPEELEASNIRPIYLGYFIQDWYGYLNAELAKNQGMELRDVKPEEDGDIWGISALDEDFQIVNRYIMYLKYGFALVTDQVCEAIHQGLMDRNRARELVEQFDGKCDNRYIEKACNYMDISRDTFDSVVSKFVNTDLFRKVGNKWEPRFIVGG